MPSFLSAAALPDLFSSIRAALSSAFLFAIAVASANDLLKESSNTLNNLQQEENVSRPDITDRVSEEIERSIELRTRDRERKLIAKIEAALKRIDSESYGYCEETGDPISIKRLEARPIATLSIEAQELHEKKEKTKIKS